MMLNALHCGQIIAIVLCFVKDVHMTLSVLHASSFDRHPVCFQLRLKAQLPRSACVQNLAPTALCLLQYRKLESRPIFVMAKKRLRGVFEEWQAAAQDKQAARHRDTALTRHAHHKILKKAWLSW